MNEYIEKSNENKYMTFSPIDGSKDILQKSVELWDKIRDLIRSISNNSDDYDKKYMKRKFISDDDLPLKEELELYNRIVVVRSVFNEGNK